MVAAGNAITIFKSRALNAPAFRGAEPQVFIYAYLPDTAAIPHAISGLSPPTLLSLRCALTV
jgi:hypothetical protein